MRQSYPLRMPPALRDALAAKAAEIGISMNALLVQILWDYAAKWTEMVRHDRS